MSLTGRQKKYIKKHLRTQPIEKIASTLGLPDEEIKTYIQKRWGESKASKIAPQVEINEMTLKDKIASFNFKNWFSKNRYQLITLITLIVIAYLNSLGNSFVSDDIAGILKNNQVGSLGYIFGAPQNIIRASLYSLVNQFFGKTPLGFRLINLFFHLGTVLTVYSIGDLLINQKAAFLVAALTAVHPFLTEAVTWISGGPYSQYSFFILLALLTFIFSLAKGKKFFMVSLFCFLLSLLSSEKAIVFPLIIFLFSYTFLKIRTNWSKIITFSLLGGAWIAYYLTKIPERIISLQTNFYQKPQVANPLYQIPVAIASYLQLIFWPKGLTLYHTEMNFSPAQYFVSLVVLVAFLGLIIYGFKRYRQIFFWLAFFIISLSPTLTPLGISWLVAERYAYLGAIGIFMAMAAVLNNLGFFKKLNFISMTLFSLLIIGLTTMTIVRNIDWKNEDNLWLAAAKTSPSSPQNHNNLGDYYGRHGDFKNAINEFQIAIYLQPNYADAYHNMANAYLQLDQLDKAVENYKKALEFNPKIWQSYQNIGFIYSQQNKYEQAEAEIQKAISINPNNTNLYTLLGTIYLKQEKTALAKEFLEKALVLDPNNQNAKQFLTGLR